MGVYLELAVNPTILPNFPQEALGEFEEPVSVSKAVSMQGV